MPCTSHLIQSIHLVTHNMLLLSITAGHEHMWGFGTYFKRSTDAGTSSSVSSAGRRHMAGSMWQCSSHHTCSPGNIQHMVLSHCKARSNKSVHAWQTFPSDNNAETTASPCCIFCKVPVHLLLGHTITWCKIVIRSAQQPLRLL